MMATPPVLPPHRLLYLFFDDIDDSVDGTESSIAHTPMSVFSDADSMESQHVRWGHHYKYCYKVESEDSDVS